jgi:hypothetical protein
MGGGINEGEHFYVIRSAVAYWVFDFACVGATEKRDSGGNRKGPEGDRKVAGGVWR